MHLRSGLGPYHVIHRRLFSAQRRVELRIVSEYKTVSTSAVLVLVNVPPIDLLAKERQETFQLRKELTCVTNQQVIIRAKKAICNEGRLRLIKTWQSRWHGEQTGRWTYRLIPELTTWLHRTAFPLWLMRNIHPLPARSGAWQGRPLIEGWVLSSLLTQWLLTCSSLKLSGSTLSNHIRDEEEEAQQQRGGGAVKFLIVSYIGEEDINFDLKRFLILQFEKFNLPFVKCRFFHQITIFWQIVEFSTKKEDCQENICILYQKR